MYHNNIANGIQICITVLSHILSDSKYVTNGIQICITVLSHISSDSKYVTSGVIYIYFK